MIKFNINNYIKFKLTEYGEQKLQLYINNIDYIPIELERFRGYLREKNKSDENGYHTMQMWYAMSIFGTSFHNGAMNIFDGNLIYIDDSDALKCDEQPTDRFAMGTPSVDHAGENKKGDSDGGRSEPLHDFLDMFGLSDKSVDDIADGILGANNKDNNK